MNTPAKRRLEVEHLSAFHYTEPVRGSVMLLRLQPREERDQRVLDFSLDIEPLARPTAMRDAFGNACHLFNVHREHRRSSVRSRARVVTAPAPELPARMEAEAWDELARMADPARYWEYLNPSRFVRPGPRLDAFAAACGIARGSDPLATLLETGRALRAAFTYTPGSTAADSPMERILETRRGVCQDYTHVMIAFGRSWGIPSRYVSGYLHLEGVAGEQTPEGASHAWAEFLLPELGWLGIDPTNECIADHRHVRVAVGRDYADAAPTRGALFGGGEAELEVRVKVVGEGERDPSGAARAEHPNLRNLAPVPGTVERGGDQ